MTNKGYRAVFVNGKTVMEHRVFVERFLSRKLDTLESVHHRNGVKTDNTVGPCVVSLECKCPDGPHNLEIWLRSKPGQPSGQRIPDLVRYAREILERYDDTVPPDKSEGTLPETVTER